MPQPTKHILVVEDDPDIAGLLDLTLRDEGFDVQVAANGAEAMALIGRTRFDLLLLDVMLPGMNGLDICRKVREGSDYTPIVILSSRSAESQRIVGLELGADDYVTKPFSVLELVSRIRALFRRVEALSRSEPARNERLVSGGLVLDPVAREASLEGMPLTLTAKEFDLLLFFARNPGRVFSRLQLLDQVWGYAHEGYEHTVNSHINRLRAKLEPDSANPRFIQTVWGVGYKFSEPPARGD
ncbi:response regulator transcription factor [Methylococcus sp. ANG]|uniref:response regulator transcription factor n=1 Tax=unclassified Methylococcus TaxID=2618889 RepID=UPI001C530D5C|nr:response regulator transcription factor [Methylococcus sp. Mc7]QXP84183.1 response regulator transcription factor [Methylococcus sp. Mc7]